MTNDPKALRHITFHFRILKKVINLFHKLVSEDDTRNTTKVIVVFSLNFLGQNYYVLGLSILVQQRKSVTKLASLSRIDNCHNYDTMHYFILVLLILFFFIYIFPLF